MKRYALCAMLMCLSGCAKESVTSPTTTTVSTPAAPAPSTTVAVLSQQTGQTTLVQLAATDPQPPSCAWRDQVIAKHIALGGSKNDVVTLANQHQVFIQDTGYGAGYRLVDYPKDWCIR